MRTSAEYLGVALAVSLVWACSGGREDATETPRGAPPSETRPNILLIVADDLGYGDLGSFGGEIETPSLDALAREGARFTRFYTHASCSPTRSLLLTGVDNHLNGLGTMAEDLLPYQEGVPGYEGYLNDEVVTVAQLLQDAGYRTYMSGKWHLGLTPESDPHRRGFETTYALLKGGGNHFNAAGMNARWPKVPYTQNGQPVDRPAGPYSSDLITDKLIAALEEDVDDGRPFFAYLAFTAPHFPLQAPGELIEKYAERYVDGWDAIRRHRFERMQQLGLAPQDMELPARIEEVPSWESLTPEERAIEARKMAIYAAMVDNLDANVGRVLDRLEELGAADDTLVVFLSDNGADPYDRNQRSIYRALFDEWGYDNSLANMGSADSNVFYGLGWAQVASVHHRHYKFLPSEGGLNAPMIARFPGVLTPGDDRSAFATALDITPTLLEVAGVEPPGAVYQGREMHTMRGRSLLTYLEDSTNPPYAADEPFALELFGHGVVFMGPWKAVRLRAPWDDSVWRLYNLTSDPGEQTDIAAQHPELLARLVDAYDDFARANRVLDVPDEVTAYPYRPGHLGDLIPEG
jgi:arylsulfatase